MVTSKQTNSETGVMGENFVVFIARPFLMFGLNIVVMFLGLQYKLHRKFWEYGYLDGSFLITIDQH